MAPEGSHDDDILQQLRRVLAGSGFARNERMSQFLRFLVERHLAGRDDELKESVIAVEVFGRKPTYDPKQDSIVRTEAGRLRARLAEYYGAEGRSDPIVIDVPKGAYVPVFSPNGVPSNQTIPVPGPPASQSRHRWLAAIALGAGVALVGAGWWIVRGRAATPVSIAVLPLQNLSPDASGDYFVDGLTDEIIRNLSVIDGLAVRSRTSSFAFQGRPRDMPEAGRQLRADYLVEGSVLRENGQLRVNAQLVRARDDVPIWSGRFDRQLTDVFAIQDEIALGIVNHLRLQLGGGRRRYETSVEAYDLYLKARAALHDQSHPPGAGEIAGFEGVIARDPSFAPAYAGLASTYAFVSAQFPGDRSPDELDRMRAAARKAIALDPLLAEAHAALGLMHARDGQWREAEDGFRRAIDLDRNRSRTFVDFAVWMLFVVGRNEEALEQLQRAEAVDPLSTEVHSAMAWVLMAFSRFDEAAGHCAKMTDADSFKQQCLGRARLGQGRIDEAVQILSSDPTVATNPQSRGFLGHAYARAGRRDEAERMAAEARFANEQALIYAGLGDTGRAFEAAERMASAGPQRLGRYLQYPELAVLRADSRLPALREKAGLPRGAEERRN